LVLTESYWSIVVVVSSKMFNYTALPAAEIKIRSVVLCRVPTCGQQIEAVS